MKECDQCQYECETQAQLNTHILLNHQETIEDNEQYTSQVSDSHLSNESRAENGEQFGYE